MKNPLQKTIAILGLGLSGRAAMRLAVNRNYQVWVISRNLTEHYAQDGELQAHIDFGHVLDDDILLEQPPWSEVVVSPGVPGDHSQLRQAERLGIPVISEIEFAHRYLQGEKVVGITGTNGKTTVTTMVQELLNLAGLKSFVGGNIGRPFSDYILSKQRADVVVLELSSFQLERLRDFRAHIACILNITPNHEERYASFKDYVLAKFNITNAQSAEDYCLLGEEVPWQEELQTPAQKRVVGKKEVGTLSSQWHFDRAKVVGTHQHTNFSFVYFIGEALGFPNLQGIFDQLVKNFKGVAHRLEYIGKVAELEFYNDAKSTNRAASESALEGLASTGQDLYLIMGGQRRGRESETWHGFLQGNQQVKKVLLIGEVAKELAGIVGERAVVVGDLKGAMSWFQQNQASGVGVFSPGFPSFDQFRNYLERGERFKELVALMHESIA